MWAANAIRSTFRGINRRSRLNESGEFAYRIRVRIHFALHRQTTDESKTVPAHAFVRRFPFDVSSLHSASASTHSKVSDTYRCMRS